MKASRSASAASTSAVRCPTGSGCSARRSSPNGAEEGEQFEHLVRHILIHEVGHHFGLSDEDMHAPGGAGMSLLLKGEGLALVRGGRLLFEGLDVVLAPGDAIHIIGPNGSGKSSLIRLVAGLLRPNAGRIERAEAALGRRRAGARPRAAAGPCAGILERAAADARRSPHSNSRNWPHVPVRLLSTGQAKRARLARVMASGAPLWLLDEPLNGLDREGHGRARLRHCRAPGVRRSGAGGQPPAAWRRMAQAGAGRMTGAADRSRGAPRPARRRPGCRSPSSCW